jgi:uncharacterized protein YndB with AHSA1/START domain
MKATGHLDPDTGDLVLSRRFSASIDEVWASITVSERLERWLGTWTGDPSTGTVHVTMNAEATEQPPTPFAIDACEQPRLLAVSATDEYGTWHLRAELTTDVDGTVLELRQLRVERGSVPDVGPGWEWYLDRLVAVVHDDLPPDLAAFDDAYAPLSTEYSTLIESPDT